jgi:hypothetical protein
MVAQHILPPGQIGDGARDFEEAVVGAGAQVQIGHGELDELDGDSPGILPSGVRCLFVTQFSEAAVEELGGRGIP